MKPSARSGAEWIANDQVTQAAAMIEPDRARSQPRQWRR
jgi:hypothetical protein